MGDGSLARACPSYRSDFDPNPEKKFLIVINHWDGDVERAEQLALLIADLEPEKNPSADVMLFHRADSRPMNMDVVNRLKAKFAKVIVQRCSRVGAVGYPFGANEMYYDLSMLIASPKMSGQYFAWINLESDCVPTHPGWITTLVDEFRKAQAAGKHAVGHQCSTHPHPHLNGVAVYSSQWAKVLGGIIGGPANLAYDIHLGTQSMVASVDTPAIFLDFKRLTITQEDLFKPQKDGLAPTIYHGVKDDSAIAAVRAAYLSVSQGKPTDNPTVYTFFSVVPEIDQMEQRRQLDLWKASWRSRGWRPVVLDLSVAQRHKDYAKLETIFSSFPTTNPKKYELFCYLRWLALDVVGGGLMTDYDVLNRSFKPIILPDLIEEDRITVLQCSPDRTCVCPSSVIAKGSGLKKFIEALASYKPEPDSKHASDQDILQKHINDDFVSIQGYTLMFGEEGWEKSDLVHFSNGVVAHERPGQKRSEVMTEIFHKL